MGRDMRTAADTPLAEMLWTAMMALAPAGMVEAVLDRLEDRT